MWRSLISKLTVPEGRKSTPVSLKLVDLFARGAELSPFTSLSAHTPTHTMSAAQSEQENGNYYTHSHAQNAHIYRYLQTETDGLRLLSISSSNKSDLCDIMRGGLIGNHHRLHCQMRGISQLYFLKNKRSPPQARSLDHVGVLRENGRGDSRKHANRD